MKCPYCAEEIQEDAILCRFCSARKEDEVWTPPAFTATSGAKPPKSSQFTMRFAGFFFFLSAIIELASIGSSVHLLGNDVAGFVAVAYHLLYIGLYVGMGLVLWSAMSWGFQMILYGSIIYSVDKLLFIMYGNPSPSLLSEYGELIGAGGQELVAQAAALTVVGTLLAWWGFVGYVYFKRDYFQDSSN